MIFDDLSETELTAIEQAGLIRDYAAGDCLIEEGAADAILFLILSGNVEVRKGLGGGRYRKLIELGPGGMVGEICFLGGPPRTADVIALNPVRVIKFERDQMEAFLTNHAAIGFKVYHRIALELAERLAQADESLRDALIWALNGPSDAPEGPVSIPQRPKLQFKKNPA